MMDEETAFMIAAGRVLRKYREQCGLLVRELAKKSGADQLRIEPIERGAAALRMPADRFMGEVRHGRS
jgi:transcriptional regulator with XRE-family HTH domain